MTALERLREELGRIWIKLIITPETIQRLVPNRSPSELKYPLSGDPQAIDQICKVVGEGMDEFKEEYYESCDKVGQVYSVLIFVERLKTELERKC